MTISKVTLKRILKEVGADRVSDTAVMEFSDIVNKYAYVIAKKAVRLAAHAKRKTIKEEDIDLAR